MLAVCFRMLKFGPVLRGGNFARESASSISSPLYQVRLIQASQYTHSLAPMARYQRKPAVCSPYASVCSNIGLFLEKWTYQICFGVFCSLVLTPYFGWGPHMRPEPDPALRYRLSERSAHSKLSTSQTVGDHLATTSLATNFGSLHLGPKSTGGHRAAAGAT